MFATVDKKMVKLPVNYDDLGVYEKRAVRERYIEQQQGYCWYCKKLLKALPSKKVLGLPVNKRIFPKNFFDYPEHLHHDHTTGMTIGTVHALCNAVLWQYFGE